MPSDDDAEIRAVLLLAAFLADEGKLTDDDRVYTQDATWSAGGTRQTGLEAIIAASQGRRDSGLTGAGSHTRHVTIPVSVTVDHDKAEAVSYFMFVTSTNATPQIKMFSTYRDRLRRTENGWRITERESRPG
ncbi:nuclear transport factor 2 family protein [Actinomadura madurae]|uniref:nuclear transport factor 2 family protein n=1 Tax=Actinomadura madurae TaxID=1993 RepID=UPI002026F031|nr:nuclear transport factor 2 family protein [Actinomadura madurae]MCP9948309.1 nuclear transport factor 2 family protein [Actinomadura madurae]MCP9965082.1 nuclear transport factor 2 family protein [Actinomadura madurae]MCP9977574.1 nuclear transport factor 2 family protein [Actinomadura madurae]MCQ0010928.1 nuclear transport factor 2 family protein [Actinomadura madurae]MCQ0013760.1 nuclear transport factor 2 family protein [Actinomadura madurae]